MCHFDAPPLNSLIVEVNNPNIYYRHTDMTSSA